MITIKGLHKHYPGNEEPALAGIDLSVTRGHAHGILGANGAGKSTLLQILTGLLPADGGRIRIDGLDPTREAAAVRGKFGLVPQSPAFYPTLTVAENLAFFVAARGLKASERAAEVDRVTMVARLADWRARRAGRLSGGLQRRLNLAIGLLGQPPILCLDEPTVGVDPQSRQFILDAVRQLADNGTTVLYTSHYMEEVQSLCDEVAILANGRVLASGPLASLHANRPPELAVTFPGSIPATRLAALADQFGGRLSGSGITLPFNDPASTLQALGSALTEASLTPVGLSHGHHDLQQLYFHLTGRELRD